MKDDLSSCHVENELEASMDKENLFHLLKFRVVVTSWCSTRKTAMEKWEIDSGYLFLKKLTGFADGLDVRGKMKSRITSGFSLVQWVEWLPFIKIEETEKNIFEGRKFYFEYFVWDAYM